jgi:hypothetical protein
MVVSGVRGVSRQREGLLEQRWRHRRLDPTALAPAAAHKSGIGQNTAARAWTHPVRLSCEKSPLVKRVLELTISLACAAAADRLAVKGRQTGIVSSRLKATGNGYRGTGRS